MTAAGTPDAPGRPRPPGAPASAVVPAGPAAGTAGPAVGSAGPVLGAAGAAGRRQLGSTDVKRLNRAWRRRTQARVGLLLESVGQPFNVGSIIRTAAAFGAERLWLCGATATPEHPSARKTALGTDRYLPWEQLPDGRAGIVAARADGLRVIAVELASGAMPLHEADLDGDICLAFGNEDRGCSAALLAEADAVAYIPQAGRVGSLNVAAAAAIALAEARRREWSVPGPD